MLLMLIGAFLAMVSLTIPIGGMSVDVLPDFAGYALIALGMAKVGQTEIYKKGQTIAWIAAAASAALLVIGMLDVKNELYILCSLAVLGIGAYATWIITLGLVEVERQVGVPLNGEKMKIPWMIYVTAEVLTYWATVQLLSDLQSFTVFLSPAAGVFYAILFYSGWRGYVDHDKRGGGLTQ